MSRVVVYGLAALISIALALSSVTAIVLGFDVKNGILAGIIGIICGLVPPIICLTVAMRYSEK